VGRQVDILGEMFAFVDFGETRFFDLPSVYLMAHEDAGGIHIHYAGQTAKLKARYAGHHQLAAAKALGATHALILVVPELRDRREFETMLRWHFRPPLNLEEVPSHMQAWRAAMHCGKHDVALRAKAAHLGQAQPVHAPHFNQPKIANG